MKKHDFDKAEMELYMLFKDNPGAVSGISGYMKENDSSGLSRQFNVSDTRRPNPFIEVMRVLQAAMKFSPEMEERLWIILERERSRHRKDEPGLKEQFAELIEKIFDELGDLVKLNLKGGYSKAELEKEGFELLSAVRKFYEKVKQSDGE
jgi:hypothetical protein